MGIRVLVPTVTIAMLIVSSMVIGLPEVQNRARNRSTLRVEHPSAHQQHSGAHASIPDVPAPWRHRSVERTFGLPWRDRPGRALEVGPGETACGSPNLAEVVMEYPAWPRASCESGDRQSRDTNCRPEPHQHIATIHQLAPRLRRCVDDNRAGTVTRPALALKSVQMVPVGGEMGRQIAPGRRRVNARGNDHSVLAPLTLYEAPAPIAGPCHEGLAPATTLSDLSAVIFLGGRSAVTSFSGPSCCCEEEG